MENQKPKSFLEKIQSADQKTKNRLMIILSAIIIIFIIYVWGAYFDFIVKQPPKSAQNQEENIGLFEKIQIGGTFAWELMANSLKSLAEILRTPKEYIVK